MTEAPALHVREYHPLDQAAVTALWEELLPSSQPWNDPATVIARKRRAEDGLFLIGELDGQPVATVMAGYDGVRGWIYALAVERKHQRRGLGRQMVQAAEQRLRQRGCHKVNLQVRGDNRQVVKFYESLGYQTEDRVSMGKPLAPPADDPASGYVEPPIYVDEDVRLTRVELSDHADLLLHLNQTSDFRQWMTRIPFPYREQDADQWLAAATAPKLGSPLNLDWAVRRADGRLIGVAGLDNVVRGHQAEIGYWLAKPYWGQGIMTRAISELSQFAAEEFELVRIYALVLVDNTPSRRVLEKAGFVEEGRLRKHIRHGQQYLDGLLMARLFEPSPHL